jgi:glutaminyl-peptide cyclotransferase
VDPTHLYTYHVIRTYPHDPTAYTEGLVLVDGVLYEGTGLVGRSSLRRVHLETGTVLQSRALPEPYFGEGIAVLDGRIFQLTWKSQIGFVYDRETFEQERTFSYATEGWGLTTDGSRLIMSDGTATLHFLDPKSLREMATLQVVDDRGPVTRLNELEYVDGEVWANVWKSERIVRIDPASGRVTGVIDLTGLLDRNALISPVDVLNGIAYDAVGDRLIVTGKLWPWLFEIEIVPFPLG